MKRSPIYLLLLFTLLLVLLSGSSMPSRAQAGDPYALIDAVNGLRAANGLPSLEINGILMSIAQGHSDYQAAIGQVTHTGAGGTRPRDRAAGAGYGGGGTFFISENIAGGTNLSIDEVISWWLGDDLHIQTMLGSSYREIGAGVAEANGFVYYTIDTASASGGGNYSPPSVSTPIASTPGGPTPLPIYLVQTAAPNPDGSIVHLVKPGQTLIGIAIAYGMTVNEIKELNYLTEDVIYEGDKLIIQRASTPGPTAIATGTKTPTRVASPTRNPTRTPSPSPSPAVTRSAPSATPTLKEASLAGSDQLGSILVVAIIVLAVGGVVLMIVGSFIKPKPRV
jgi:hypothetical protein